MKIPAEMSMKYRVALRVFMRELWHEGGLDSLVEKDFVEGARRWKAELDGGVLKICARGVRFTVSCAQKIRGQWHEIYFRIEPDEHDEMVLIPTKMWPSPDLQRAASVVTDFVRGWPRTTEARRKALKVIKQA